MCFVTKQTQFSYPGAFLINVCRTMHHCNRSRKTAKRTPLDQMGRCLDQILGVNNANVQGRTQDTGASSSRPTYQSFCNANNSCVSLGPVHTGRTYTAVNGRVHTAHKQHQRVCRHICTVTVQICLCILCEGPLVKSKFWFVAPTKNHLSLLEILSLLDILDSCFSFSLQSFFSVLNDLHFVYFYLNKGPVTVSTTVFG